MNNLPNSALQEMSPFGPCGPGGSRRRAADGSLVQGLQRGWSWACMESEIALQLGCTLQQAEHRLDVCAPGIVGLFIKSECSGSVC